MHTVLETTQRKSTLRRRAVMEFQFNLSNVTQMSTYPRKTTNS